MSILEQQGESSGIVHFSISGEFITRHARDRIFERGWEDAVRFLNESIHDFTFELSISVLSGKNCLKGINNIELDKESPEITKELTERIDWTFAGTVFDGRYYWRPYAYVDNWGEQDINNLKTDNKYAGILQLSPVGVGPLNGLPRSVHYMDDRREDRPIPLNFGDNVPVILWKRVSSVPLWYHQFTSQQWQEALDEYLKFHKLEHRGHQQWYPNYKSEFRVNEDLLGKKSFIEPETHSHPPMPEADIELKGIGWITLDGSFYACEYAEHKNLADTLLYYLEKKEVNNPEREVEKTGWIKIGNMMGAKKEYLIMYECDKKITKEQEDTLLKWCDKNGVSLPYWYEEKRPNCGHYHF